MPRCHSAASLTHFLLCSGTYQVSVTSFPALTGELPPRGHCLNLAAAERRLWPCSYVDKKQSLPCIHPASSRVSASISSIHLVHPSVQYRAVNLVLKLITFYRLLGKRSNTNKSPVIPLKCRAGPSVLSMGVSAASHCSTWQGVVWLQGSDHTAWMVRGHR